MKLFTSPHKRARSVFNNENENYSSPSKKVVPALKDFDNVAKNSPSKALKFDGASPRKASKWGIIAKVRQPFSQKSGSKNSDDLVVEFDERLESTLPSMDDIAQKDEGSKVEDTEETYSYEPADFDELSRAAKRRKSNEGEDRMNDSTMEATDPTAFTPRLSISHEITHEMVKLAIEEDAENVPTQAVQKRVLNRKATDAVQADSMTFEDLGTLGDSLKVALFNDSVFSDVMFRCGHDLSSTFLAHRVILAHRSEYFKSILSNAETTTIRKDSMKNLRYIIDKPSYNPEIFAKVLEYIYTGSVELRCDNVLDILQVSDDFRMSCLKKLCTKYLIANTDTDNLCAVLQTSRLYHAPELTRACLVFVEKRENVIAVFRSEGFCGLNLENLIDLIKRDNLPLSTDEEIEVFEALMRWHKCKVEQRERNEQVEEYDLNEIMKYIRFPLMNTEQLSDVVEMSGMVCQNLLFEAYRHHVVPLNKLSQNKKLKGEKPSENESATEKKERELKSKRFSTRIGYLQTTPRSSHVETTTSA